VNVQPLFHSFFLGGFECSNHKRKDGRRLDLIASTRHDEFARQDYERLGDVGMSAARDGIRWHRVEPTPGRFVWDSLAPMLHAARDTDTLVIWDLLHFGWPEHVDVFASDFADRFRRFVRAFLDVYRSETSQPAYFCPVNEISFLSFAGGEEGFFNPFAKKRGDEMKAQLVRASIAATEAIWDVLPDARVVHTDPIIDIIADPTRPQDRLAAEGYRQSQFQAWDMIAGRQRPELGGKEKYLDVMGLNYYIHNQWIHNGSVLVPSHPQHLPVRFMLREVWEKYRRPLFISETGIEDQVRPNWMHYIGHEIRAAMRLGVPVGGVTLYPIVNHPGWEDDRHCLNGLWDYADDSGHRDMYEPLAIEIRRQQRLLADPTLEPSQDRAERMIEWGVLDSAAKAIDEATTRSREAEL
jgi:beta-glucosidase/6-phospho-beta-glucosidase/beta-galactosidase